MKFSFDPKPILKRYSQQLQQIRDAPHAVAGGVAIGMFWGFTPLTGLKTLLSVLMAWLFRCSKLSAALTVAFHDILTPIWPVVLRWEYQLGFWLLSHPHHLPPQLKSVKLHVGDWLHWKTLEIIWPTCVGSLFFGIPGALLSYWLVERFLERYERLHPQRLDLPS